MLIEEVISIGKIVILSFADSEEYVIDRLKKLFRDENGVEYAEEIEEPILSFQGLKVHVRNSEE